jgi:S1-C subfamily serine protease
MECYECQCAVAAKNSDDDADGSQTLTDGSQTLTVVTAIAPGSQAGEMNSIAIGSIVVKVGGTEVLGTAALSQLISSKPRPVTVDFFWTRW